MTVLEDAGLTLLAVHDEVLGRFLGAVSPFPLDGGGEIGATPAAQACRLHRLDHGLGSSRLQGRGERGVGASPDRVADVFGLYETAACSELAPLVREHVRNARMRLEPPRDHRVEQCGETIGRGMR